jgi:DNA-binding beta-propeller fold protein YncE
VEGLGYRVQGVVEGFTTADGVFKYVSDEEVEFYVGDPDHRLVIGTATLHAPASGRIEITPRDLAEAQGASSDNVTGNVSSLLQALDADGVHTNGIEIDAATRTAIAGAIAAHVTPDFARTPGQFASDANIVAVMAATGRTLVPFERAMANFSENFAQPRSSTLALTSDDRRLVVVNREKDSVSVVSVRDADGADTLELIKELPVGKEPRFVALAPDDSRAYVTNAVDGTLTVIDLTGDQPAVLGNPVAVGIEPRGIAVTPNGGYAFVANHTIGAVTVLSFTPTVKVIGTVATGGNPQSIAITNDGDGDDRDEHVFVTRLFGELIDPATRPDGYDDAKQGVVDEFLVGAAVDGNATVSRLTLAPRDSGFTADRRQYCLNTREALQSDPGTPTLFFNSGPDGTGDGAAQLAQETFCPDPSSNDASADGPIAHTAQGVYPNMLHAVLVRGPLLYVPNVGAQPEPPVTSDTLVQGLVGVLDRVDGVETNRTVNLNTQINSEAAPPKPTESMQRLFANDIVAIDANRAGTRFLVVSRGGNYVIRVDLDDDQNLTIGDPGTVVRFQTGNVPTGVVMSRDGNRAYTNNEVNLSVTAIDLAQNKVLTRDVVAAIPPAPGTPEHRRLLGKLAFYTALGVPDSFDVDGNGSYDVAVRDIVPLSYRNRASDNAHSSCSTCHEDGHSDNVTWIFASGPRQTIPLEGTFARGDLTDQRILDWSGTRGSITDFNNQARGVQGGRGFATNVNGENRTNKIFHHGPTSGISDSLDAMTEWVASVRAPIMPDLDGDPTAAGHAGHAVFETQCASCHGGSKWTKSRTSPVYQNNPTFAMDPLGQAFFFGVPPIDPNLTVISSQIQRVINLPNARALVLLENVGTFDAASPLELCGGGSIVSQSTQGYASSGPVGFNVPSLLGLAYSAPYLHDGSATTLEDVFARHQVETAAGTETIDAALTPDERSALLEFLRSIDDTTQTMESDTDRAL